jgi:hypothetical protein
MELLKIGVAPLIIDLVMSALKQVVEKVMEEEDQSGKFLKAVSFIWNSFFSLF